VTSFCSKHLYWDVDEEDVFLTDENCFEDSDSKKNSFCWPDGDPMLEADRRAEERNRVLILGDK